jgi:protease II
VLLVGSFLGAAEVQGHADNASIDYLEVFAEYNLQVLTDTETSLQYIKADNILSGTTDLVTYDDYSGPLQVANSKSYRIAMLRENNEFTTHKLAYRLTTLHKPPQVLELDLLTRDNAVKQYEEQYEGVRHEDYVSERILLPGNDGVKLPVTLLYSKVAVRSQKSNCVLLHSTGADPALGHNFSEA